MNFMVLICDVPLVKFRVLVYDTVRIIDQNTKFYQGYIIRYYKQEIAMTDFYEVYPTFDSLLHAPNTLYHALRRFTGVSTP